MSTNRLLEQLLSIPEVNNIFSINTKETYEVIVDLPIS